MDGPFDAKATNAAVSRPGQFVRLFRLIDIVFLFSCCVACGTESFLRSECTVILMAGLPGDLESESTYRNQLQSWLEILQTVRPKGILALADNPESINLPLSNKTNTVPLTILPASRSNFLSLAAMLTNRIDPVVLIAWGHGGKQGNIPVFHVRGPRITVADFSNLADQIAAAKSHWVLSFRGSGFFAAQLAKDKREILSSESDTMFNNDPLQLSLLLKIVRAQPAISFDALAKEAGRVTVDWYQERNLARTEEPALWLGSQNPLLLAARSSQESALASVEQQPTNSLETASNAPSKEIVRSDLAGEISGLDLPAIWKELKRVARQDYPEADAVILRRRINYTLGSSPAVVAEHDDFVQILTVEGKRFGDLDFFYNPPFEDINFSECEVLSPQGKLARLNPDAIREAHEESVGDYQPGRRKFFSLPGVVPGAVLHVHYRNEWKKFPLPHVSLEIPISGELAVLESSLQVTVPKDGPFHFALENVFASFHSRTSPIKSDPVIEQTSYGAAYTWQFTNLMADSREILAPPGERISLLVSTFPDWSDFAEWYARISKLTDVVTPEIADKAAELTREAKTDRDKIVALYNYVTRLRYVAIPLGVNSFRPHAAASVLKNQFGDCKDKANLFNAMLHSLNFSAHLVLVPRFRQAYDALPGLAFNHAISRVTLGDETLWVDTTDDVCRFGMLPPGDAGRKVLVIAEQTNWLSQLPLTKPEHHKLTLHGKIDCSSSSDASPVSFDVEALGYPDYELREAAREAKEHAASFPLLAARFRLTAGSFALEKQSGTSAAALDENFSWRAEGNCIGVLSVIRDGAGPGANSAFLRAPFWLPKEWDLALHRRKTGMFLNQGYPLILDERLEISFPPHTQLSSLPGLNENREGPLKWKLEWTRESEAKVRVSFRAALAAGEVSATETSTFQQQLRAMLAALNTVVPL